MRPIALCPLLRRSILPLTVIYRTIPLIVVLTAPLRYEIPAFECLQSILLSYRMPIVPYLRLVIPLSAHLLMDTQLISRSESAHFHTVIDTFSYRISPLQYSLHVFCLVQFPDYLTQLRMSSGAIENTRNVIGRDVSLRRIWS